MSRGADRSVRLPVTHAFDYVSLSPTFIILPLMEWLPASATVLRTVYTEMHILTYACCNISLVVVS